MQEAGETEDAARNDMIAHLCDLYKLLDGADEKRLDESQDTWMAGAAQSCPDQTSDYGTTIIDACACLAARYAHRSALFGEIIAGCRAGACPIDKL